MNARFGAGQAVVGADIEASLAEADGMINATPIGMVGHPGVPISPELLRSTHWVAEVIYFPLETELLRTAARRGMPVSGWRRHGSVPGGRGLSSVHRSCRRPGQNAAALCGNDAGVCLIITAPTCEGSIADQPLMSCPHAGSSEIAVEQGAERIAIGDAEEAERTDHEMQIDRGDISAEHARSPAPREYLAQRLDHCRVLLTHLFRLRQVLAVVDVLDGDKPDEIRMRFLVIEGEGNQPANGIGRAEAIQFEFHQQDQPETKWYAIATCAYC